MRAVVNFASGAWYPKGQERLRQSLITTGFDGRFWGFQDTNQIGGPLHINVPYAFKTFSIKYAWTAGYNSIIYADASIWAVKSWEPVWRIIESQGYYFEEAGHVAGSWTKDGVLQLMGITRDQAMSIPLFSAGFTGLCMDHEIARKFFEEWHGYACDGYSFQGTWGNCDGTMSKDPRCKGHRHDMTVASILAWKMGMKLGAGGTFLAYIGKGYAKPQPSVVAYLRPC